jgi:hypothetical protein
MATTTQPTSSVTETKRNLVEVNWDPITRIVGNLGIFTKIDFANRQVAECYSTSSVFRGYSVFMQGKDPRDAPFITSRICGICIACTMPGFPDKFMPFMDEPPGAHLSAGGIGTYGKIIRALRAITNNTANKEPKWRHTGTRLTTGYQPRTY